MSAHHLVQGTKRSVVWEEQTFHYSVILSLIEDSRWMRVDAYTHQSSLQLGIERGSYLTPERRNFLA